MGLQQNYTTHGVTVTPELTGGIGISHSLDRAKSLTWTSTMEGNLALGRGISTLRAETGLNYDLTSRIHLGAGVSVDGVYNNQPAARFMHDSGVRVGEYLQGDVNITKNTTSSLASRWAASKRSPSIWSASALAVVLSPG